MDRSARLERDLWRLSEAQDGVLSREDLRAAGLSSDAVAHRVRCGRLWPWSPGVFVVGRPGLSTDGERRAAVCAGGPGAVLSHTSAAALWELRREQDGAHPHVTIPTQAGRRPRAAIVLHRAATLTADDVTVHLGIPVTTPARTLLDLAAILDDRGLKAALREAEYRHGLDLDGLRHTLDCTTRSPKHCRLRRTLDDWVPGIALTESELEAAFLELCAFGGIELPVPQVEIGRYRVDFLWRALRLIVEVDGYTGHRGRIAFQTDRAKDRTLTAGGYVVLRFTQAEVTERSGAVAAELRAALRRRRDQLAARARTPVAHDDP